MPIVGYDEKNVYVHTSERNETKKFKPINKKVFDKSRKAAGTDEDILVVYRLPFII